MTTEEKNILTIKSPVLTARQLIETQINSIEDKPSLIANGIMGQMEKRITHALPKHLKTMEAFWEGFHIASGIDYFGFPVTQGKVLYIGIEGDLSKLKPRIEKMAKNFPDMCLDNIFFTILPPGQRDIIHIRALIDESRPMLTIIDPLTNLLKKEDKKEDVEGLLNDFDKIIVDYNTALHIIHHSRKSNGRVETLENMRGSTALTGWADTICQVNRVNNKKDKIKLSFETRYGADELEDIVLNFDRDSCSFTGDMGLIRKIQQEIHRLLFESEEKSKRLYVSEIMDELEDTASERTIEKAINDYSSIEVKIDDADKRRRYIEKTSLKSLKT